MKMLLLTAATCQRLQVQGEADRGEDEGQCARGCAVSHDEDEPRLNGAVMGLLPLLGLLLPDGDLLKAAAILSAGEDARRRGDGVGASRVAGVAAASKG